MSFDNKQDSLAVVVEDSSRNKIDDRVGDKGHRFVMFVAVVMVVVVLIVVVLILVAGSCGGELSSEAAWMGMMISTEASLSLMEMMELLVT